MRFGLAFVRALGPWPWLAGVLALLSGGMFQAYAATGAGLFRMFGTFTAVLCLLSMSQAVRRALRFDGYLRLAQALDAVAEAGGRWRMVPPAVPRDPGAVLVKPAGGEPWVLAVEPLEARVRGRRAQARLEAAAGRARIAAAWAAAVTNRESALRPDPPQVGIICLLRRAGPPVLGVPQLNPEDVIHLGRSDRERAAGGRGPAAGTATPATPAASVTRSTPVTTASAPAPPAPPPAPPTRS